MKFKIQNSKFKIVFIAAFSSTVNIGYFAQQKENSFSFSLQQAIEYALKNNINVQNAAFDELTAKNKVKEIIGIGLPQINGSFDVKDFVEVPTSVVPGDFFGGPANALIPVKFGVQYNATAGIEASQLVFDGTYLVGLQATKTYLEVSKKMSSRSKIETTVLVTKAYYTALVNEERMKLLEANIIRLKKLVDDTKVLNENGFVEKIDVDRLTVTYNNVLIEKDKLANYVDLGLRLLKYQMGMDQSVLLTLTDKLADIRFEAANFSDEKIDYSKRVEYNLVQTQVAASKLILKKDQFGYLPNFVLYGAASLNAFRNDFSIFDFSQKWYPTALIGGRIGVPIFDGLQKNYKIQQSKLEIQKSENNLRSLQMGIDMEISSAKSTLKNSTSSLEIQKKNIELAEEVYRVSKLKYDQGVGSNLEILNAETSLKEAQTNYFSALYDALIAKVEYEKAIGAIIK